MGREGIGFPSKLIYYMAKMVRKLDDLEIYLESLRLTKEIFDLCKKPKLFKEYALCDQLKRASISVCANIAEGYGRRTKADFSHFLSIALGSCNEQIALLDIAKLVIPELNIDDLKQDHNILGKRIYMFRKHML